MKAAIRLLVRFILWFALIILISSALVAAHSYVTGFDPKAASNAGGLVQHFVTALAVAWLPSVLLAAVIALFSAARAMSASMGAIGSLAIAWTLMLVSGGLISAARPSAADVVAPTLPVRSLVRLNDYLLYALDRDQSDVAPLVVHDNERDPGFTIHDEARIAPETGELVVEELHAERLDLTHVSNSYSEMVEMPRALARIATDAAESARLLALTEGVTGTVIVNLLALSLYLVGCWTLVRLTRWPLFNAVFVLAALRFALWIVPAVQAGSLREMLVLAFGSTILPYASALVLAGAGIALFAVLVFLPSLDEWRREVEHV